MRKKSTSDVKFRRSPLARFSPHDLYLTPIAIDHGAIRRVALGVEIASNSILIDVEVGVDVGVARRVPLIQTAHRHDKR